MSGQIRRQWSLLVVALLLLAACAQGTSEEPNTSTTLGADDGGVATTDGESDTTIADSDGDGEKVLTIGVPGDVETVDPCCANFIRSHEALLMIYDVPVIHPTTEQDGALVGDATELEGRYFESWEAHDDGLTYTIKVREGVTFADGTPITAETVRYMVERNLNTPGGGAWLLANIAAVSEPPTVVDEYTLELKADRPSPLVMQSFYMSSSAALDPASVEEHATEDDPWATEYMQRSPTNASGPYELVERVPDQELVFQARDDFYLGAPAYDTVIMRIIPSPAERVQLLEAGAIDVAVGLGTEEFAALVGAEGVNVIRAPSKNMAYIGMNNSIAPFDNQTVRQAVSYGVDYEDILQNVYDGDARRLWGPLPDGAAFSLGDQIGYSRDVDMAVSLLEEAGYGGEPVTLTIDSGRAEHQLIAVRVQAALGEIGMPVEIEQAPSAVFAERKAGKELQMFVDESLAWIDDPNYSLSLTLEGGVFGNYADYQNERVDEIIAGGWLESDSEVRREMFEEAQRLIVEDAPWVFLAQPDFKIAMRDTVEGFVLYPNEIPRFADLRPAE